MSDIEGKAARVAESERGQRASFKRIYANGRRLSPFGLCACFPRFRRRRRLKRLENSCSARELQSVPIIEKHFARGAKLNGATGVSDMDGEAARVAESEWTTSESVHCEMRRFASRD
jgi:hypothetical protein